MIFNIGGPILRVPVLNTSYPANVTGKEVGGSATFKVVIAEDGIPAKYTYQWYVNGAAVEGATGASYTRSGLTAGSHTVYCIVTNAAGSVQSRTATLTVTTHYLYNKGASVGWEALSVKGGSSKAAGTLKTSTGATSMTLWAAYVNNTSSTAGYVTRNAIDVTPYKKLSIDVSKLDGDYGCTFYLCVYKRGMSNWDSGTIARKQINATGTVTLDISSVSGEVGVGIRVDNNESIEFIKMTYTAVKLTTS